jgi:hypothetical protein
VDGVGHGSLLAGRYRLEERARTGPDGSLWRAVDETLERQVSVRIVRPGHRYTADVVDAARRAALVEDARLVRVLDVGESNGTAYIVAEHLVGRTLEELLVAGPVPAETVRRLVGEAAQALDRASARGLHHLRLNPSSLVVAPDGTVKVLGTAVEAALAGVEQDEDPIGADRTDAVGLVSVLYAGLTGRWPGAVDGPLGPAPRITGRAVPPGDLVSGVPNDLDTLCTVALGPHDDGPQSPGELAQQLAPWARTEPMTNPRGLGAGGPTRPERGSIDALDTEPSSPANGRPASVPAPHAPAAARPAAGPGKRGTRTVDAGTATLLPRDARPEPHSAAGSSAGSAGGGRRPSAGGAGTQGGPAGYSTARSPTPTPTPAPAPSSPAASSPAAGALTQDPAGPAQRRHLGRDDRAARSISANDWSLFGEPAPQEEPLGPFMPPAQISRPPHDQTRLVLAVVAGLVVLGLVLALLALWKMGSPSPLVAGSRGAAPSFTSSATASAAAAPPPGSPSASASGTASASASGTASASASGGVADINGIQAIDPQGDGNENGASAEKAIDGDPATNWRSDRYQSATFGGLKKGLGLYLELQPGVVTSVTVSMPGTGGAVELRSASGPGLDSSAPIATATAQSGTAVLRPAQPVTTDKLLLWFTELPQQSFGEYRLVVSEITVA